MKKRYLVATAAALIGGSLVVEMQAGSTGVGDGMTGGAERGTVTAAAGAGAGSGAAGAEDTGKAVKYAALRKPGPAARSDIAQEVSDDIIVTDAGLTGSFGGGSETTMLMPSDFSGVLVQPGGYDGKPLPKAVANPIVIADGLIIEAGGGGSGGAGGTTPAKPDLLGRNDIGNQIVVEPQAISSVPEPATWISFIVGLGLVGYSLRQRSGPRSVAS